MGIRDFKKVIRISKETWQLRICEKCW